jgi:outer membrane lipoprotein SlyB
MTMKTLARNVLLAAIIVAPGVTSAQDYHQDSSRYYYSHGHRYLRQDRYDNHHHYRTCNADRRRRGNNGTAIGAVTGGVLGATLGGGIGSTLLGAGAGAVAGHAIAKDGTRC